MNIHLDPPAERDLPAGRPERMRTDLLTAISAPRQHRGNARIRLATVAAVTAAIAGVAAPTVRTAILGDGDSDVEVVAMSAAELPTDVRDAAAQRCLNRDAWGPDNLLHGQLAALRMADLAVLVRRGPHIVAMFITTSGWLQCEVTMRGGGPGNGGLGYDDWKPRDWLPGPVQRLTLSSTELDGGEVMVTGRVSARVHRLVLDHGTGRSTPARLQSGVFGLISDGTVDRDAALVSYDDTGAEIGRRALFRPADEHDSCYVDGAGTIVYPGPDTSSGSGAKCRPAEPWRR